MEEGKSFGLIINGAQAEKMSAVCYKGDAPFALEVVDRDTGIFSDDYIGEGHVLEASAIMNDSRDTSIAKNFIDAGKTLKAKSSSR